ncbi:MAG: UDP-N-acetylglucosamine--N-acetylmuramyl-(pentapeptide) pyrophosphoryl-undecaprenol N-acetylglucosamine transferase [bacterium]|nr:UDP-N-acetylglucosamine--N-acetylmuramyl-(pentapeptide) pyrophosphoryl-undecaprenol N-acetylglucosamine transferase [bacterium]
MNTSKTICFVAGKSGGHIIPCLTLAQEVKVKEPGTKIIFFSTCAPIDLHLLHKNPFVDAHIALSLTQLNPKKIYLLPVMLYQLFASLFFSARYLIKYKPQRVISTGGFIAIPVCLIARMLRIPIELYELNVQPGKALTFLAPFAQTVHTCFKKTQQHFSKYHCAQTMYPVRFTQQDKHLGHDQAHQQLQLDPQKPTLLVLGGSQGSHFINQTMKKILEQYPELHNTIQIIHQTGEHDIAQWCSWYAQHNIPAYVFEFQHDMSIYYCAADIIVCRAGAGTLFEVLFFNKSCIVIPLETTSNNHQLFNAQEMVIQYQRLFTMLRQQTIEKTPQVLVEAINRYLFSPKLH